MTNKQNRTRERLQPIRPAKQMPMPDCLRTKEMQWRCCRKHTGVPRSSPSLPKTCKNELWRMEEEKRPACDPTTLRPRQCATLFSTCLPPFIEQEGSRLGINFLPTESNYLRSSYVPNSLLYTTKNVRARRAGPRALVHRLRLGTVFFTTTA